MDDMFLVQYATPGSPRSLGLERDGMLYSLPFSLDWLLSAEIPAANIVDLIRRSISTPIDLAALQIYPPVSDQEIWAAGVTYKRSEEARELESNNSTIYTRVYHAERPELFFKSLGSEVVGSGHPVGIRHDAVWSIPEPELVVVLNARMEVIGFTAGNDMSSRDIEGENPLYLPQAKVYEGSCAVGPRLWLKPGVTTWPKLTIRLQIERGGIRIFEGQTSTDEIHRNLSELVDFLGRCKRFPHGAMLFTGTGIVPPDDFTLAEGDIISVRIDPIGELVNTVYVVGQRVRE